MRMDPIRTILFNGVIVGEGASRRYATLCDTLRTICPICTILEQAMSLFVVSKMLGEACAAQKLALGHTCNEVD